LVKTYGTTAWRVLALGKNASLNERLAEEYPFLKSEVLFAIRCEMAQKPNDVVCRRVPVSFIDTKTTVDVILPQVVDIFAKEFNWDKSKRDLEL
jgi:glycerol-3-phosphate dehydrogenase